MRSKVVFRGVALALLLGAAHPIAFPTAQAQEAAPRAFADITLSVPADAFVENTSLSSLQERSDACGTDHFAIDKALPAFQFSEPGPSTTGCGEMGFALALPPGVSQFTLVFEADRRLTRADQATLVDTNSLHELRIADEARRPISTVTLFPARSGSAPLRPFVIPLAVPEGQAELNITWYFEDRGFTPVQRVPGAGSADEFSASVQRPRVIVLDHALPAPDRVRVDDVEEENVTVRTTHYGVVPPQVHPWTSAVALRFVAAADAEFAGVTAPGGAAIPVDQLVVTRAGGAATYEIPAALVAGSPGGTYTFAFVTRTPLPAPTPPSPPVALTPLAFVLVILPVLPAAFAARATLVYARKAHGRYVTTARILGASLALAIGLYAGSAAYVFLMGRIPLMEVLPLAPEGAFLDALFLGFTLVLAGLWIVPGRYAMRAMQADVEERRRAELKFRGLLEAAPDAIVIMDARGTIVLVNAQVERLFGRPRDEVIGRPVDLLLPGAPFDVPVEGGTRHLGGGADLEGIRKDGTRFPVEVSLSPIETEDGTLVTAAIRDVTVRRRTQAELQRSNQELEHFAYVASHDLQEPLRTIAGFAQLLEQRYSPALDDRGRRYVERTVAGSQRMQALINDLLAYSRIQTQGRPFEAVDLAAVVDTVIADLEGVRMVANADVTRDVLPTVRGDATQLAQVFSNLVRNAIKYRHPDRAPVIRVTSAKQGREWRLSVHDNGIGIEPEYHEKVFIIFQRLAPRGDDGGTGLGLAISRRIIERHGGRIWVESQPGVGSTFHFTLPDAGAPSP